MKLNVLLTGGSGFIGRNILESYLIEKYNIIAPRRSELDLVDDDNVKRCFAENKIDVVIHSAIKPGHRNAKDPTNLFYTASRMFFNITRHSASYRKLIVLGSGSVYDMMTQDLCKVSEDFFDTKMPLDEHGFFRFISAKFIELMDNSVDLRIFSIFGKYEDYEIRFISNAICKAIYDLPITIKQNRRFDFLYIDDLMPILDHFIQNDVKYKAYNITPNSAIDLYEIALKAKAISGKDLPIVVGKPGMGFEYSGSNKRLRDEVPGLRFSNIDESISKLYRWYSENKHSINRDLLLFDK